MQLILASTSSYRAELLDRLGLTFVCVPSQVDETPLSNETPQALAQRLAHAKAAAVLAQYPQAVVIGSDQVADCAGQSINKTGSREGAIAQLTQLSGQTVQFHSAVSLQSHNVKQDFVVSTEVVYRHLSDIEIVRYVNAEPAWDCAGSSKIEGLGVTLMQRVSSDDPTALIGLPLIRLSEVLRNMGFFA